MLSSFWILLPSNRSKWKFLIGVAFRNWKEMTWLRTENIHLNRTRLGRNGLRFVQVIILGTLVLLSFFHSYLPSFLPNFLDRFFNRNWHSCLPSSVSIDGNCRFFDLNLVGWLFFLFFDKIIIFKSLLRYFFKVVTQFFFRSRYRCRSRICKVEFAH